MRLIIVSNRLPFTAEKNDSQINLKPSSGGLVSGISSYLDFMKNSPVKEFSYVWLGWPGIFIAEEERKKFDEQVSSQNVSCVYIEDDKMEEFYQGFCNNTIWPLFHYFPAYTKFFPENWNLYKEINQKFCDKICQIVRPGDTIWIQDYHLMLLPQMLRQKLGLEQKIGFFLHIPFPSFEVFRIMPSAWREDLLKGLLGCDLVGFHINEYTHSFLRASLRILGLNHEMGKIYYKDRIIKADTFPIGIEFEKFASACDKKEVVSEYEKIKEKTKAAKLIFSVDRLDYTKGIINRLVSFEEFLQRYPQYHKKVIFVLIIVPSRVGIGQYQQTKNELDNLVSLINSKYGDIDWQPLIYQYKHVPFDNLVALYKAADVSLITPLRDGMNLVAKEYLACKTADNPGVLILSEMAGAAKELSEALIVNPNDTHQVAEAIKTALETPADIAAKNLEKMHKRLKDYGVVEWAEDFVEKLDKIKNESKTIDVKVMNQRYEQEIKSAFNKASNRLIMLDYDGTLVGFNEDPKKAVADDELVKLLNTIDKKCDLALLSGRDQNFLGENFKDSDIALAAEHGGWIRQKGKDWKMFFNPDVSWKKEMIDILKSYSKKLPGSFVEEKKFSLAFHYRKSDPEMADLRVKELVDDLVNYTSNHNLQILYGNKVVEIRNYEINKANAGLFFANRKEYDFILFAGDDLTDEDLFKALKNKNAYTVKVGFLKTFAKFNIIDYREVRKFLKEITNG